VDFNIGVSLEHLSGAIGTAVVHHQDAVRILVNCPQHIIYELHFVEDRHGDQNGVRIPAAT
jgi:hypothetical protein